MNKLSGARQLQLFETHCSCRSGVKLLESKEKIQVVHVRSGGEGGFEFGPFNTKS